MLAAIFEQLRHSVLNSIIAVAAGCAAASVNCPQKAFLGSKTAPTVRTNM
jgi:hypothetical protein